jgi:hypothetical protein
MPLEVPLFVTAPVTAPVTVTAHSHLGLRMPSDRVGHG